MVAQDFPWPVTIGSHLRLAQVIEVALGLGQTDVFALVPARRTEPCLVPPDRAALRLGTVVRPRPRLSASRRARWFVSAGLPLELVQEEPAPLRRAFEAFVAPSYDFVWVSKAATYELLGRPRLGPTAVDLDDLEDAKIRGRLSTLGSDAETAASGRGAAVTRWLRTRQALVNAGRWGRLQRRVADAVDAVVLCSDLDASRCGLPHVTVVPNGYDAPARPVGDHEPGHPPTLLLAGNFHYPPNADAAHYLVTAVLPVLTARHGPVSVRLVGEAGAAVTALAAPPAVTVVGRVPAMEPELARADLVVVPVRYGSGTRVKVLEAAAHRLPVVSTTVGAEGLGFENGTHLLVADDPDDFAAACIRLLTDAPLRASLVAAAQKAFLDRFQWSAVRGRIEALARHLAGAGL